MNTERPGWVVKDGRAVILFRPRPGTTEPVTMQDVTIVKLSRSQIHTTGGHEFGFGSAAGTEGRVSFSNGVGDRLVAPDHPAITNADEHPTEEG